MKKVLVTGGAGFVGSHLVHQLLKEGCYVFACDNLITGDLKNLYELQQGFPNQMEFAQIDITQTTRFPVVEEIYNLACPASPDAYGKYPINTLLANTKGIFNLMEHVLSHPCAFFQASTSEVYGCPDEAHHPQTEKYHGDVNILGQRSCYDEGKRVAETILMEHSKTFKTAQIRIGRIFNTYGPKMGVNDGRVVTSFIRDALKRAPIVIYGDGRQTRSFCYVTDTVAGIIACLRKTPCFGAYNIGNPYNEISIEKLAKIIIELTESNSDVELVGAVYDDPVRRKPVIDKLKEATGWTPNVSLKDGLLDTIQYIKTKLNIVETL